MDTLKTRIKELHTEWLKIKAEKLASFATPKLTENQIKMQKLLADFLPLYKEATQK